MPPANRPRAYQAYRPDIDGLRGIAVLSAIGFHASPGRIPGGFAGVDVFFVISGFLITGVIIRALGEGSFSFAEFYARRIRRLFPALILVLGTSYLIGWFVLLPGDFVQLATRILAGAGFVSNFVEWRESGYFDQAGQAQPLLHLWSLGVEEQFYLAWPLLLFFAWKRRFSFLALALLIAAASFLFNIGTVHDDVAGVFYSPVTRFWELMLGGALACAIRGDEGLLATMLPRASLVPAQRAILNDLGSVVGLGLVVISLFVLNRDMPFPGWWAVLPVAGTLLLIASGPEGRINRKVLSQRALVSIGLISYPFYLWTWPLLAYANIVEFEAPSRGIRIAAVLAGGSLAWLTYEWVEKRVRFGRPGILGVPVLCALLCLVSCIAIVTYRWDGMAERDINKDERALFLQKYRKPGEVDFRDTDLSRQPVDSCAFFKWEQGKKENRIGEACARSGRRVTWLLWGDSYAGSLSDGIRALLPADTRLVEIVAPNCPPEVARSARGTRGNACIRSNEFAMEKIGELKPEVVILAQASGHEFTSWRSVAGEIQALGGKKIVLVGPAPQWLPSLPLVVAKHYWGAEFERVGIGLRRNNFQSEDLLRMEYENSPLLAYVSLIGGLCSEDGCLARIPGGDQNDLMAFDSGHLSRRGSIYVSQRFLRMHLLGK